MLAHASIGMGRVGIGMGRAGGVTAVAQASLTDEIGTPDPN